MAIIGTSLQRTTSSWRTLSQQSAAITTAIRHMHSSDSVVNKKLEGKVAIITGAAGSIGSVTSELFAAHGAHVIIADIDNKQGEKLAQKIGSSAVYKHTDVSSEESIASTVDFAVKEFGKLDIMYNNAGVVTALDTFQTLDMEQYDRYTSIMVRAVVCGIKHAARVMAPRKRGVILTTSSTASVSTGATIPLIYNINKQNLPGLTKIAAFHLARDGIRVNAIAPHGIPNKLVVDWMIHLGWNTDFETVSAGFKRASPLKDRHCTAEDIAKGALFLCSDDSSYISGQNLVVDAGFCNSIVYDPLDMGDPFKDSTQ